MRKGGHPALHMNKANGNLGNALKHFTKSITRPAAKTLCRFWVSRTSWTYDDIMRAETSRVPPPMVFGTVELK